jgi:C_GCAxxG_C_C family probable redox protein
MESRFKQVNEKHEKGYNCAQSIACTYCDIIGLDEKIAFELTEGFGNGMGGMQCTCGAVTAACMIMSNILSSGNLEKPNSKAMTYRIVKEICDEFLKKTGSLVCKELKGIETGVPLKSCPECISCAMIILENKLEAFIG